MKKKILILVAAILATLSVSAVMVSYLSNTVVEEMSVESPVNIDNENFVIDVEIAGNDDFALIKLSNLADVDVTGDIVLSIGPDSEGIDIAITEDINYCFKEMGDMTGVTDCKTDYMIWMENNPDWNDWIGNAATIDAYPSPLVINHNGDSYVGLGYTGNDLILPGMTLDANSEVYGVVYLTTDISLEPGEYTVTVEMVISSI